MPFVGYDGTDVREAGWNGDVLVAFTVPPGGQCPAGGAIVCGNQTYFNLTDPVPLPSGYTAGYAAFDSKGLFRGFIDKVYAVGQGQMMVYRDPDASGSTGVGGAGSEGPLRWGAWTSGAFRTGGAFNTATLFEAESHYVVGRPLATALGSGSAAYAPIVGAASRALQLGGIGAGGAPIIHGRGVLSAFAASWDAGTLSGSTLGTAAANITLDMAGGLRLSGSTAQLSAMRLADLNFEPLSGASPGQAFVLGGIRLTASDGTSCNRFAADGVTLVATECTASIRIGLVGNPATHAVLSYSVELPAGTDGLRRTIQGNAALRR